MLSQILIIYPLQALIESSQRMNIISNMQQIADLIIRPNRYLYKPIDLGPRIIQGSSKSIQAIHHSDYQLMNNRKQILKGSLYTTEKQLKNIKRIIIYLHCNSGCRIEGLAYLNLIVAEGGFALFVFDFAGSGVSEGKHISLGYYEADDIKCVIKFLRRKINKSIKIGLWGRSMGAVAALRYLIESAQQNEGHQNAIKGAILDSPFYSLKQLFVAIGREKTNLPKLVLEVAMKYLKPIVLNKAKFDIDQVNLNDINKINGCPGIFIASKNDSLIPFEQMDTIFRRYGGSKQMFFVEESHNEPRNMSVVRDAFKIMKTYFEDDGSNQNTKNKQYTLQIEESKCALNEISQTHSNDIVKLSSNNERDNNYRSQIPSKEVSRKKLQLTIKSYSQRTLLFQKKNSESETPKKSLKEISFPQVDIEKLEKRQISCLFEKKRNTNTRIKFPKNSRREKHQKGSYDEFSEEDSSLNSSLHFKTNNLSNNNAGNKKAQITIRKFFKQDNNKGSKIQAKLAFTNKNDEENEGFYSHINLIKLNSNFGKKNQPSETITNNNTKNHNHNIPITKEDRILQPSSINIANTPKKHMKSQKTLHERKQSNIKVRNSNTMSALNNNNSDPKNIIHERKTMQHIANKKPPLIQNYKMVELRNSFEGKYKSEYIPKK